MLPDDAVERFSLDHGSDQFAVSLYVDVSARDFSIRGRHSRLERVRIAANLRHADYDALNERFEAGGDAAPPTHGGGEAALVPKGGGETALVPKGGGETALAFEDELRTLWQFAVALEAKRGKPSVSAANLDYNFIVKDGRVAIVPRRRGAPLDKLVSELMILANTSWGELLAERDVAALYRVQTYGKVRMSVHPEAHEGLGVSCYAWLSSPLRRYVDLVNQWQLIAALSGARAPFARNSDALLSALRAFETTYARYDEHQRAMENYWCLRWLLQEKVEEIDALLLRENLVRLAGLPLVARVPSLPQLEPGVRVRLRIDAVDLLERSLACSYRATLGKDVTELGEDREPAE
jgi:exoribonuclease-2